MASSKNSLAPSFATVFIIPLAVDFPTLVVSLVAIFPATGDKTPFSIPSVAPTSVAYPNSLPPTCPVFWYAPLNAPPAALTPRTA